MAKSLAFRSLLKISGDFIDSLDIGQAAYPLNLNVAHNLANGTGAGQANQPFTDIRSIDASASEEIDLSGSLVDAFGDTIAFTKIKFLAIIADDGNANNLVVGGAASNAWSAPFADADNTVTIKPGGAIILVAPDAAGYAVTADTADKLKIANGGAGSAVSYKIVLIGTVA